jgi:hypothetical protein
MIRIAVTAEAFEDILMNARFSGAPRWCCDWPI